MKNKQKRLEHKRKIEETQNTDRLQTLHKLKQDIEYTKDCMKQLETTLDDANKDIRDALKEAVFIKDRVSKAHAVIDMALEHKRKLETTLEELNLKKRKL